MQKNNSDWISAKKGNVLINKAFTSIFSSVYNSKSIGKVLTLRNVNMS